jgi:nucleotide-binding universal stress UspA family protein
MFKHIILATDFGPHAEHAQAYALDVAQKCGAKLTLLHVYGVPVVSYGDEIAWPLAELGKAAQAALDKAVARARETLPNVQGHVVVGEPRNSIVDHATEVGADLIVLGTHARQGLAHAVLGSVAESIVRSAPMPVFVVPPAAG